MALVRQPNRVDVWATRDMLGQVGPIRGPLTIIHQDIRESSKKWFIQIISINYFTPHEAYFPWSIEKHLQVN
jgi:hypothetical protein